MDVLIIALTKQEFDNTVATYPAYLIEKNRFHHITKKEDMLGYHMPVQIRFIGRYRELPDAPSLEFYAQHITGGAPVDA